MKKLVSLLLIIQFVFLTPVMAQEAEEDDFVKNTQMDIITVAAAGLGGAILGLSTLSFVDQPNKRLGNIWTGAAIGVIAGVILVAYNSASKNSEDLQGSAEFNTSERVAWHQEIDKKLTFETVQFGTQLWQTTF